jgi:3-oxoacyl-[acyl-carrier protein] reductase
MPLTGKQALITGAGEGLGAAIADHYVAAGASVMLCARTEAALEAVAARLRAKLGANQSVHFQRADVSIPADVDHLVQQTLRFLPNLSILVNNAGIYGPIGLLEETDWAEWTKAIEINLYGLVYSSRAVLPHFKRQRYGKIINLSGGGATNPLPRLSSYAASKAAVVRFSETLALECAGSGIDVNSIAPGALATRMMEQLLAAGPHAAGPAMHERMTRIYAEGGTPLDRAASLCVYLGSSASDGISGKLISAVWDPWSQLADHSDELAGSDIYTLRRITPEDRGKSWGKP